MRLIDAQTKLLSLKQPVFQTSDAAICLNIRFEHASKVLERLAKSGFLIRLMRGKWAIAGQIDPLIIPEYLTAPFPSYISLQTALYYHGMISQIPSVIYAVSLSRTRRYETPMGVFSIHHLQPDFFFGFDMKTKMDIKIASAEKALLDILYLSPGRTRLFKTLPEFELTPTFKMKECLRMIKKIKSIRARTIVKTALRKIIKHPI